MEIEKVTAAPCAPVDGEDEGIIKVRDELETTIHQIRHLIRSQRELQEYVEIDNDREFLLAIDENNDVIAKKIRRARMLREELLAKDATYKGDDDSVALEEFHTWEQAHSQAFAQRVAANSSTTSSNSTVSAADNGLYL